MPSRSIMRRPGVLLALALVALAGLVTILGKLAGGGGSEVKQAALGNQEGSESYPAFSPDGRRLAVSARKPGEGDSKIFIRDLGSGRRTPLTTGSGSDTAPAWSPDGKWIAFVRTTDNGSECMIVAADGGDTRSAGPCATVSGDGQTLPAVAWMPDSKALLVTATESVRAGNGGSASISVLPLGGGQPRPITHPPEGISGDSAPTVSPDGASLAFVRSTSGEGADIFISDLSGANQRQLTFEDRAVGGIAWTADGKALIYSARRMGTMRLWRLPADGGSARDLMVTSKRPLFPAVSRSGDLAFAECPLNSSIWRASLRGGEMEPIIRSRGREIAPVYSPDGSRIANISDVSGNDEVWVQNASGGARVQITRLEGKATPSRPRWSPDGKTLAFGVRGPGLIGIYTAPAAGGPMRRIVSEGMRPSWSQDGKSVLYDFRQIWKAEADGSNPAMLTHAQGAAMQPEASLDGKFVYYRLWGSLWRVPVNGGEAEQVADLNAVSTFQLGPKGVYFRERRGAESGVLYFDFDSRRTEPVFRPTGISFDLFSVSPDGKFLIFPRVDATDTNITLVKGL